MPRDYSSIYLKRARRYARLFQLVPFLRCFILNGSVAGGKAKKSSDIDILIIAKGGRIYTARFFTLVLAKVLGIKRSKDENKSHAGKFCFNYFLADSYLLIPMHRGQEMDQYCRENYGSSILLWGDEKDFNRFLKLNSLSQPPQNVMLNSFQHPKKGNFHLEIPKQVRDDTGKALVGRNNNYILGSIRKLKEFILSGWLGNRFEELFKRIQIRSIERDPRTKQHPNLIAYSNQELRFHPPKQ